MMSEISNLIRSRKKLVIIFTSFLVFVLLISSTRMNRQQVQRYHYYKNNSSTKGNRGSGYPTTPIPELLEQTLVDVWEPYDKTVHVPYFWAIPKTGTRSALAYLRLCLQLVEASHKGASSTNNNSNNSTDNLQVISQGNHRFINVNLFTSEGMERAVELQLLSSGLLDFVTTDNMYQTMTKFFLPSSSSSGRAARMFTLFRHPVEREVSRFHFMQYATWERLYDPKLKEMTLEEYVSQEDGQQQKLYDNWMVRSLTGKVQRYVPLSDQDLDVAKEILRRKCLVGLTDQMAESLQRFQIFFQWQLVGIPRRKNNSQDTTTTNNSTNQRGSLLSGEDCKHKFLIEGRKNENPNKHPKVEKGTSLWNKIANVHRYDVELYTYAVYLFDQQAPLYSTFKH